MVHAQNSEYSSRASRKYPKGLEPRSLSGKFNGKTLDTITLFPLKIEDGDFGDKVATTWVLLSRKGTVPRLEVQSAWPQLENEGDLDGNGTVEWGVTSTGRHGCWYGYQVYTLHRGSVKKFIPSIYTFGCEEEEHPVSGWVRRENGKIRYEKMEITDDGDFVWKTFRIPMPSFK